MTLPPPQTTHFINSPLPHPIREPLLYLWFSTGAYRYNFRVRIFYMRNLNFVCFNNLFKNVRGLSANPDVWHHVTQRTPRSGTLRPRLRVPGRRGGWGRRGDPRAPRPQRRMPWLQVPITWAEKGSVSPWFAWQLIMSSLRRWLCVGKVRK